MQNIARMTLTTVLNSNYGNSKMVYFHNASNKHFLLQYLSNPYVFSEVSNANITTFNKQKLLI